MTQYTEGDARIAALEVLAEAPGGLTTAQLRKLLTERLAPDGHDAELVVSRGSRDTFSDQRVRNLTSHRSSRVSLVRAGLVTYTGRQSPLVITPAGRAFLADTRRTGLITEGEYRRRQWNSLVARGGPMAVPPGVLIDLRVYRGAQGIWTDAERTRQYGPEFAPITVALLHTGDRFADELTAGGLTYHYPRTERAGRDAAGIEATKRAARLGLRVFVITHEEGDRLRDVRLGTIIGWDDATEIFEISFAELPEMVRPIFAASVRTLGSAYRRANEEPRSAQREPFEVDPNAVDRALGAHAQTQNALADWVTSRGLDPMSSMSPSLDFDLAWVEDEVFYVAEVKSLPEGKEARQLRLGLGQVLHYQVLLQEEGRIVRPVLAVEHEPVEGRWNGLCQTHGVTLVWPSTFDRIVRASEWLP
jgi:hypothetical protein